MLPVQRALATADPSGRYHCVRLLHVFDHGAHLCLAFEPMAATLREVQDKFGAGVGLLLVGGVAVVTALAAPRADAHA
jgi:hypothetical protein